MKLCLKTAMVSAMFATTGMLATATQATTITFDTTSCSNSVAVCGNSSIINADWGSVAELSSVSYVNPNSFAPNSFLYWGAGYSGLPSAAWGGVGPTSTGIQINITPLNGNSIKIISIDVGAYGGTRTTNVTVNDGNGNQLLPFTGLSFPVTVDGTTASNFTIPTFGSINPSSSGFQLIWGNDGWNIGINNIVYEVVDANGNPASVPLPGTLALLLGGFALIQIKRKSVA